MRSSTTAQAFDAELLNYVAGRWVRSRSTERKAVLNPATAETLAEVPLSAAGEVDDAVRAAAAAFREWRATPVTERIQPLYRLKALLEEEIDDVARTIVMECGKTFAEAKGEIRRGIENVEVACGAPTLMQGTNNEDVARGIDEHMIRQPLGVVAAVTPFNFPAMIPLWFLPYAVATGNAFVLKPSERVPLTSQALFRLIERAGFPAGVLSLVNGGRDTLDKAIALVNARSFGNQACLFTSSGAAARAFRHRADAGNIGINLGVAAPMAFFPFSGWNDSFFGDLHAQASHGVEFYTQTKVVIERWPDTWSRTF